VGTSREAPSSLPEFVVSGGDLVALSLHPKIPVIRAEQKGSRHRAPGQEAACSPFYDIAVNRWLDALVAQSLSMRGLFARVTGLWFGSSNGREDKAIIATGRPS
jgi:hypothetical protein